MGHAVLCNIRFARTPPPVKYTFSAHYINVCFFLLNVDTVHHATCIFNLLINRNVYKAGWLRYFKDVEHLNDKDELTRLENLAQKLGFSVDFQSNRSWNNSGVSFYPERLIKIGIRNFDANTNVNVGKGFIPERIKELILAHEIGHILTYKTLYPKLTFEKYVCCSIEFKLWDEIYSWKVALSDTENLDIKELEFAQEQINEYLFCNTIGTRIINEQCELSQKIITKFTRTK